MTKLGGHCHTMIASCSATKNPRGAACSKPAPPPPTNLHTPGILRTATLKFQNVAEIASAKGPAMFLGGASQKKKMFSTLCLYSKYSEFSAKLKNG